MVILGVDDLLEVGLSDLTNASFSLSCELITWSKLRLLFESCCCELLLLAIP